MKPIIEIKGLSKKYRIRHGGRYLALRDEIADFFKKIPASVTGKRISLQANEDLWAVKDISLDVTKGQAIGIIGRNGAGKTTLLKLISRITYPTEGEICLRGRVASLLEVGTGFHPELTGRENIYFNGSIFGMKKREIDKKFDEIVDFAEVEKFLDTPIKHYSSGMRMRLAFAVAAHLEPEILLIDEVLAVGDVAFQKKCLGKMENVTREGRTILFISHNMSAINQLCNRCILLDSGRKIIDDTKQKAIEAYLCHNNKNAELNFPIEENMPAQIIKAAVLDSEGRSTNQIRYQDEFEVSVIIEIREKSSFYHTLMAVKDSLYNSIIFTTDRDVSNSVLENLNGYYEYRVKFPAKLLKPGNYYIRLVLKRRERGKLMGGSTLSDNENSPLSFEILDLESIRAKENRYSDAAVAPELPWHLNILSQSQTRDK